MDFEKLVAEDWQRAVAQAVSQFQAVRERVVSALQSPAPQVRSAAIAVLLESDDSAAHDSVVGLLLDPDEDVRNEVLEYLTEFARAEDAESLLSALKTGGRAFLATSALCQSVGVAGPILDDEDPPEQVAVVVAAWEKILRTPRRHPQDDA